MNRQRDNFYWMIVFAAIFMAIAACLWIEPSQAHAQSGVDFEPGVAKRTWTGGILITITEGSWERLPTHFEAGAN